MARGHRTSKCPRDSQEWPGMSEVAGIAALQRRTVVLSCSEANAFTCTYMQVRRERPLVYRRSSSWLGCCVFKDKYRSFFLYPGFIQWVAAMLLDIGDCVNFPVSRIQRTEWTARKQNRLVIRRGVSCGCGGEGGLPASP